LPGQLGGGENACALGSRSTRACRADSDDYEDKSDRADWQYDLQEIDCLKTYVDAFQIIPAAIRDCYFDFRRAALEVKLSSVVCLRKAILSLEPCVANLEEARQASDVWRGPDFLEASWMYLHSYTLDKPVCILRRMQECYEKIMSASETEAQRGLDVFEHVRGDLDHCLENSVVAFVEDMKVFQFAIDREAAKRLTPVCAPVQAPAAPRESDAQAAERMQVQGMNRDELQALLALKFPGK
jgi:hypothetical protein